MEVDGHAGLVAPRHYLHRQSYKNKVKLTFAKGAFLQDAASLFNASLDGNMRRAMDIYQDEEVDEFAFKALILEAIAFNSIAKPKASKKAKS